MPHLDERQKRVVAGAMVEALGRGGQARVAEASTMSTSTVNKAVHKVRAGVEVSDHAVPPEVERSPRSRRSQDCSSRSTSWSTPAVGTPMSHLRWTSKSTYDLADELVRRGFQASAELVRRLLHQMGYSLQAPAKAEEGTSHPDRDAQFVYLNKLVSRFVKARQPVISVDTKKKELIGEYANGGREWHPEGEPTRVGVHDFVDPEVGRAIPYGIYDIANDEGWVSVGDTADTAEFAVESIRRWWNQMGRPTIPKADKLLITADAGGSNGYRVRAWKAELAKLAAETRPRDPVVHYPPGTSKWNKIEHRMFSFITMNWRGRPLTDIRTIVELIAATKTKSGLSVQASYDPEWYPTGVKVTDKELAALPLTPHKWHGDWNYTIAAA